MVANDRLSSIPKIAGYLKLYKALDQNIIPPERPEFYITGETK